MKKKRNAAQADARKQYIWRHNGFRGQTTMIVTISKQIEEAPSTTPKAKELAGKIWNLARQLVKELETRIDP